MKFKNGDLVIVVNRESYFYKHSGKIEYFLGSTFVVNLQGQLLAYNARSLFPMALYNSSVMKAIRGES